MINKSIFPKIVFTAHLTLCICLAGCGSTRQPSETFDLVRQPYQLDLGIQTRSISFENPTGAPGEGGKEASEIGVGRKGHAAEKIPPGHTVNLCDIKGPGIIRHIWMTGPHTSAAMRSLVLRVYWEGQKYPSIECPYGDFFGNSNGHFTAYQSAVHTVSNRGGMNIWLPMPFARQARMTLTNESADDVPLFYQIDYSVGDKLPSDVGRLHVLFRRENPTTEKKDFELLPLRIGKGRYIGTVIGVRGTGPYWWGEGEVKMYLDGDKEFPTYCGTGVEDYIGLSYGLQKTTYLYGGCPLFEGGFNTIYRWHLADAVVWNKQARITIQQLHMKPGELFDASDDWSCASFWYEPTPSAPLPPMPDLAARTADIWKDK